MTSALPADLAAAFARVGVDVHLEEHALQDAILSAISDRRGYIGDWWVDGIGGPVHRLSPVREEFRGLALGIALAWRRGYGMSGEFVIDQSASCVRRTAADREGTAVHKVPFVSSADKRRGAAHAPIKRYQRRIGARDKRIARGQKSALERVLHTVSV
jgi:hypothetical protein